MSSYSPNPARYANPDFYRRCGRFGLKLPLISLGCWHNFGTKADHENARQMLFTAFDHGITHFDLANNYGPIPGSAEERVGRIVKEMPRDELIISTKAGYLMWPGPYGEWGSRKYLLASLDQSLKRMGLDYVDIFYSHRWDGGTPLDETMGALDTAVKQGKALYVGISSYSANQTREAAVTCAVNRYAPLLIHQPNYSILNRWIETRGASTLIQTCAQHGLGIIAFCPLYQGMLTDKYLNGIPKNSRAADPDGFLREKQITPELVAAVRRLNDIAKQRGQTLAQMSLAWVLRDERVTTALIGASTPQQIIDNVAGTRNVKFSAEELKAIDAAVAGLNLKSAWATGED